MTILLTNVSSSAAIISDLGIELPVEGSLDLRPRYSDQQILGSAGLSEGLSAGNFSLAVDGVSSTFSQLVTILTYLNQTSHEILPTLKHALSQPAYVTVARNVSGLVTSVTSYTDATMTQKIREEIYTRSPNSVAIASVTTNQYDTSGNLLTTEVDFPTRDTSNKVVNYSATTS
jgi:hypothetical protein